MEGSVAVTWILALKHIERTACSANAPHASGDTPRLVCSGGNQRARNMNTFTSG